MYFIGPPYRKTVQLRHRLPDGSSHIDWMLATDSAAARPVVTFRVTAPVHTLTPDQTVHAERIGDHRSMYLDYEGPVSGDRGEVTRVAAGQIRRWQPAEQAQSRHATAWHLEIQWLGPDAPGPVQSLRVAPESADRDSTRETDPGWTIQMIGEARTNMRE